MEILRNVAREVEVGIVLSGARTDKAICQVFEDMEGKIREGMFLVVKTRFENRQLFILSRVAKIEAYNEFFEVGDVWSEARRKRQELPIALARRYIVCELELLGVLPRLDYVPHPPYPGDKVYLLSNVENIFSSLVRKDEICFSFGDLYGYEKLPIIMRIEALPMHIAVLGVTGSGKSYTVGYLIERLSQIKVDGETIGYPIVIIDANGDYLDYYYHKRNTNTPLLPNVKRYVFPSSYAAFNDMNSTLIKIDLNLLSPRDLAEIIVDYYKLLGSELSVSLLERVLADVLVSGLANMNAIFYDDTLFRNEIESRILESEFHYQTKAAALRAITTFREDIKKLKLIPNANEKSTITYRFIDDLTENFEISIFDFSVDGATGISIKMKQLVVSYLSKLLFKRFTDYKMGRVPVDGYRGARYAIFIIEEAQNYCPNIDRYPVGSSVARETLAMIATQGRKFGLGLVLITQRPSFVDPIVMSMVNTYIIHRISPEDVGYVRRIVGGLPESIIRKLTSLETGVAVIHGQALPLPFPLLVRIPRRFVRPTIGTTDVSNYLRKRVA